MRRESALALVLALAGVSSSASAQVHGGYGQRGVASPLRRGTGPTSAPKTDPTTAPAQSPQPAAAASTSSCPSGNCASTPPRSDGLIIPARTSSDLTTQRGGAIPASSTSISGDNMQTAVIGAPGSGAQIPVQRQPLSDVLPGTVRITIRAISARRQGPSLEIDGRLGPIDRDLRSFADQFSYRSYRLLDVQTFDLDFRSIAQMELPGSRAIEIEPRQLGPDGRVKVHLELLGQHPEHATRMRTDYSIPRGRTILVGGYRIDPNAPESGTLLLAITQDE